MKILLTFGSWWKKWLGGGGGSGSDGGATSVPELDASQLGVALVLIVGGMLVMHGQRRIRDRRA